MPYVERACARRRIHGARAAHYRRGPRSTTERARFDRFQVKEYHERASRSPRFYEPMAFPATSEPNRPLRREVAVSVVVPVFNEEASLRDLHRRLRAVLESVADSWEVVYVDDGSTDGSRDVLHENGRD